MSVEDDVWKMLDELETDPRKLEALVVSDSGDVPSREVLRLLIRMYRVQTGAILKLAGEIDRLSSDPQPS
jgi:hypothetical protein